MLTYRLTNCVACTTIPVLLADIDCKLTQLGKDLYNNIIFALNNEIPSTVILDLLMYKRILQYKSCNAEYANEYDVDEIAGKVKLLIFK